MLLCSIEEAWGNDFLNNPNKNKNNILNSNKNKIKSNISKNNQMNNQMNNQKNNQQKNNQQKNNQQNINKTKLNKSIKVLKGGNKKENVYNNIIIFTIIGYIMLFISHICFELGFELNN